MSRRPITFICAYYENAGMLREQFRVWRAYPPELREQFHAIVTDDGSPCAPARLHIDDVPAIASFSLFRTLVDVRWNWLFCRNLAVEKAQTEWVLLTDIDHVLPEETARFLMEEKLNPRAVYRFSRVDAPALTPYKPHPNTWLMTRAMFDAVGGYDERFSGYYGSDAEFRERVQGTARSVILLPYGVIRYPREHIADASTTTYGRKEAQDATNVRRIRAERALIENWTPIRVSFPYVQEFPR